MIYFIRPSEDKPFVINERWNCVVDCRPIKIGSSHDPLSRLKQLKVQRERDDLELLGVVGGGKLTERSFHQRFSPHRITFSYKYREVCPREWFRPSDDLLSFIEANAIPLEKMADSKAAINVEFKDMTLMLIEQAALRNRMTVGEFLSTVFMDQVDDDLSEIFPFRLGQMRTHTFLGRRELNEG